MSRGHPDETTWQSVVDAHAGVVWQTVCRLLTSTADREDCYQSTFADAFTRSRQRPVKSWPALLRVIATRRAIDRLRRPKMASLASDPTESGSPAAEIDAADSLRAALAMLPEQEAEVFVLVGIDGLTYGEAAAELGLTVNNIGVLLHRARKTLRAALATEHDDAENESAAPRSSHELTEKSHV